MEVRLFEAVLAYLYFIKDIHVIPNYCYQMSSFTLRIQQNPCQPDSIREHSTALLRPPTLSWFQCGATSRQKGVTVRETRKGYCKTCSKRNLDCKLLLVDAFRKKNCLSPVKRTGSRNRYRRPPYNACIALCCDQNRNVLGSKK